MGHKHKIKITPKALLDIQEATDWYNNKLKGLGSRFQKQVITQKFLYKQKLKLIAQNIKMCIVWK